MKINIGGFFTKALKGAIFHLSDLLYLILPKREAIKLFGNLAIAFRTITWRAASRYCGAEAMRYRSGVDDFVLSHIEPGDDVLDVGCAEGKLTALIAKKAGSVLAVDIDRNYINSIDKNREEFRNVRFIIGDALVIEFEKTFDAAILAHIIEHLDDSSKLLTKLSKIARKIVVETPDPDCDWVSKILKDLGVVDLGDDKHVELFNINSLKEKLEKSGWSDVRTFAECGLVRAVARSSYLGTR